MCVCVRERESERERGRERDRMCVCVCVFACVTVVLYACKSTDSHVGDSSCVITCALGLQEARDLHTDTQAS